MLSVALFVSSSDWDSWESPQDKSAEASAWKPTPPQMLGALPARPVKAARPRNFKKSLRPAAQ